MRPKTANPSFVIIKVSFTTAEKNPGPGQYDKYETVHPTGKLYLSKYQSSGATTFNPSHSKRFLDDDSILNIAENTLQPGPGHYKLNCQMMAQNGTYFVSNLSNSRCRSFTRQVRDGIMQSLKEKS